MLIIEGNKNTRMTGFGIFPDTHDGKIEMLRSTGRSAARSGEIGTLRQVFMISEGWMAMVKDGKLPGVRPSQDPNRKEALIISGLRVADRSKNLKLFEMRRGLQGELTGLDEIEPGEGKDETVDVPLLDAFVEGFQLAFRERTG